MIVAITSLEVRRIGEGFLLGLYWTLFAVGTFVRIVALRSY